MTQELPNSEVNGNLFYLARRIRSQMRKNKLSATALAEKCRELSVDLYEEKERPNINRERISKILMNAQPRVGKGAAKVVTPQEIFILSKALNAPREWLTGQAKNDTLILWDAMSNPEIAAHVFHLLAEYEERTGEILLWGETLLCSLTPPEFSHELHLALFKELGEINLTEEMNQLVKLYDSVGDKRRKRTFENIENRHWEIKQIIFLSELQNIAGGADLYSQINALNRQKCLDNLIEILKTDKNKIKIIVVEDKDAAEYKHFLRDFDRFSVNGDKFTLWSSHLGKTMWTENRKTVLRNREILTGLENLAAYRENAQVVDLLFQLREKTHLQIAETFE